MPGAQPIPVFLPLTLALALTSIAAVAIVVLNGCAVAAPERLIAIVGSPALPRQRSR